MPTIDEIRKLKEYYIKELYPTVRKEQKTDQEYRDDTFSVDEIKDPHTIYRLGTGARIVDAPAEQIVTSNPQAFLDIEKGGKDAEIHLGGEANRWLGLLKRQNPNPFKESVKNKLGCGENYIQLVHNELWVTGKKLRYGSPVLFLVPDPRVIYGSPEEDEIGIPSRVVVFYERQPRDVILNYPKWSNPKKNDNRDRKVEWLEYWDKDVRYFEADGEAVLKGGIQKNLYGFTPFIRKYSGFGRRSPQGKIEDLIVSDLRFSRDLIKLECITLSNIASIEHIFAHKTKTITSTEMINQDAIREGLRFGAYDLNILDNLPADFKIDDIDVLPPTQDMYQHLANIQARIAQRNPFIMAGFPFGTSGRQQDLSAMAGMRRYDTVVENTELAWATAIEKALHICKVVPTLSPASLRESDLEATYHCTVKLKASDPVEDDRLATLGSRLLAQNEIDPETNLIEFKGYTQERARQILIDTMKWKVILNSPEIIELIGLRAAEKSGMLEDIQAIKARRQQLEKGGVGEQATPTQMQRTMGETETQAGAEMGVQPGRGARQPPERFTRGQ